MTYAMSISVFNGDLVEVPIGVPMMNRILYTFFLGIAKEQENLSGQLLWKNCFYSNIWNVSFTTSCVSKNICISIEYCYNERQGLYWTEDR